MFSAGLLIAQTAASANSAIFAFLAYMSAVMLLAWLSSRVVQRSSFLNEYFLGSRDLGIWAFALTFAATSASGGSFIGFPSLVYTHGWSVALWISSYMLVPLVAMGLLAKRLNQIARQTDALTIPDLVQERFQSSVLGLLATLLIIFFTTFNLIAQFKGGSVILQTLLSDVPLFQQATNQFSVMAGAVPWLTQGVDPGYLLCLLIFAVAVVAYTTYGGFRAVVWTDVLQGVVMVLGVLILLPMTLIAVGGLGNSTRHLASSKVTQRVRVALSTSDAGLIAEQATLNRGMHVVALRGQELVNLRLDEDARVGEFGYILPLRDNDISAANEPLISALHVPNVPQQALTASADNPLASQADPLLRVEEMVLAQWIYGANWNAAYVSLPGPSESNAGGFLPISAGISFFFFWCFASAGQPSNMIRCMAFRDSRILSRAIFTVSIYYSLIYFPIVIIFCCARTLLPGWELESDRIMPEMATSVTAWFGVPWLAGLLVAAPFAAVMSTMDSFLLLVSSSVVRDIYQRWIHPEPNDRRIKVLTYSTTLIVGVIAMLAAVNPPRFLQEIIVFTGAGLATSFLVPVGLALYWPRFNAFGAIAGMLTGFLSNITLYAIGSWQAGEMAAYEPWGFSPFLVGMLCSLIFSVVICLVTPAPKQELVVRFFHRRASN